jgi:hypothetical protein
MDSTQKRTEPDILPHLYKLLVQKGLGRLGSNLYKKGDRHLTWTKYKGIREFVRSLEGVPFEEARHVREKEVRKCIDFLETYTSEALPDIDFYPSLVKFKNGIFDVCSGELVTGNTGKTPILNLEGNIDVGANNGSCIMDDIFEDPERGYALLGYLMDSDPPYVWDNVSLIVSGGTSSAYDALYDFLNLVFSPTFGGCVPLQECPLEAKLVLVAEENSHLKEAISLHKLEDEDFTTKIVLVDWKTSFDSLIKEIPNKIVKLPLRGSGQLDISVQQWLNEMPKIAAKISRCYRLVTEQLQNSGTHPCKYWTRKRKHTDDK